MAKAKTGTKASGDALAKAEGAALAPSDDAFDELAEFFDEVGVDGLEDVGGEDVRLAVILWNMKGLDPTGKSYPRDVFFNTITEETVDAIECALLLSQKTKRYDSFDNALDKTVVHCESRDRVSGTMEDGTTRPCAECPDDGWFKHPETGKPLRKCGEVHNVVGVDRLTQRPFAIRFKKTGLKPFRTHLMAHHWGARMTKDRKTGEPKRVNVPLFCYAVRLTLKMHESGKYATPVLDPIEQGRDERGNATYLLPIPEVRALGENAKHYVEIMGEVLKVADAQSDRHDTDSVERNDGLSADDFND